MRRIWGCRGHQGALPLAALPDYRSSSRSSNPLDYPVQATRPLSSSARSSSSSKAVHSSSSSSPAAHHSSSSPTSSAQRSSSSSSKYATSSCRRQASSSSSSTARSANLLLNGGFETGSFLAGWDVSGSGLSVASGLVDGCTAYSGSYFALLGAVGNNSVLMQSVQLAQSAQYNLSLYLAADGGTPSDCTAVIPLHSPAARHCDRPD